MKSYLAEYGVALVVFLALDFVWLKSMGPGFYASELKPLLRESPHLGVALGFYVLFVAGLVFFVIHPAARSGGVSEAVLRAAFFGLVTYATYDLTNLATIKGFTLKVAVVDMAWGIILSATVTGVTLTLLRLLKPA
jgi:uncharacterized membrane protein